MRCAECEREHGPHYRGPCPHGGRLRPRGARPAPDAAKLRPWQAGVWMCSADGIGKRVHVRLNLIGGPDAGSLAAGRAPRWQTPTSQAGRRIVVELTAEECRRLESQLAALRASIETGGTLAEQLSEEA